MKHLVFVVTLMIFTLTPTWGAPIHDAVLKGSLVEVDRLLAAGENVNAVSETGDTPLHFAAALGHLDISKRLIVKGADVNAKEQAGWTPLLVAAARGKTAMCQLLVEGGANINATTGKVAGTAVQDEAASGEKAETTHQLIVDRKDAKSAAFRLFLLQTLAASVGDAIANSNSQWHTVGINRQGNYIQMRTLQYTSVSLPDPTLPSAVERMTKAESMTSLYQTAGRTPLHHAVITDNLAVVKICLATGANLDLADEDGATPLMLAKEYHRSDIIGAFAAKGLVPFSLPLAIRYGSDEDVTRLLATGADVKAPDDGGDTPLHIAVNYGRQAVVNSLIAKGADINARNSYLAQTPLYRAAATGNTDILRLLLAQGAKLTDKGSSLDTPLHAAARGGHAEAVQVLLAHHAAVNALDSAKTTPLYDAARWGHYAAVKVLLANGANVNGMKNGPIPLSAAVRGGNADVVKLLLEDQSINKGKTDYSNIMLAADMGNNAILTLLLKAGAPVEIKPSFSFIRRDSTTALANAARNGHYDTVKLLLENGASATGVTISNLIYSARSFTPLHAAAQHGSPEIITLLLSKGAEVDLNTKDVIYYMNNPDPKKNQTPLCYAVKGGHVEAARLLLDAGADPNTCDANDTSPFQLALDANDTAMATLLIEKKATIEPNTHKGRTALHLAAMKGNVVILKVLLARGANVLAKDQHNYTPAQLAVIHNRIAAARWLLEKDPAARSLHAMALIGNVEEVRRLVNDGANINSKDSTDATPLHKAVISGNENLIAYLLEKGAKVNAKDNVGFTPLHLAALEGQAAAVTLLLNKGAESNPVDQMGATPLLWATSSGAKDITEQLITKGATVNTKDADGTTPLIWAVSIGNLDLVRILVRHGANLTQQDGNGRAPLAIAQAQQQLEIAHLLQRNIAKGKVPAQR
jgi:ankyrin repeat protein